MAAARPGVTRKKISPGDEAAERRKLDRCGEPRTAILDLPSVSPSPCGPSFRSCCQRPGCLLLSTPAPRVSPCPTTTPSPAPATSSPTCAPCSPAPPRSARATSWPASPPPSATERVAAQMALADLPLRTFLDEPVIPYEDDDVTRLIVDSHDAAAFARRRLAHRRRVPRFPARRATTRDALAALRARPHARNGRRRQQDHAPAGSDLGRREMPRRHRASATPSACPAGCRSACSPTIPTDDPHGIAAAILDGLLLGAGDAVIGINPATDSVEAADHPAAHARRPCATASPSRRRPACWPTSPPRCAASSAARRWTWCSSRSPAPRRPTASFGVTLALLREARDAALRARARHASGDNVMYFETGQGSALSADAHHGVDQQTLEARAYAVARALRPAAGQHRGRLHRPGISLRRQADHPRRAGRPLLRQAARPADGRATSATPTTPRPTRTTWTRC